MPTFSIQTELKFEKLELAVTTTNARSTAIFSFFSGGGFLDLGFELEGFEIAHANEIHRAFLRAYVHSRQTLNLAAPKFGFGERSADEYLEKSLSAELASQILSYRECGRLVGFIGGPPCPDFSVAGKNRGEAGDNGRLSRVFADLICKQKPDFFLFENVKGLYRTAKHRTFFESLKTQLTGAGYVLEERLTNAIEFGAPQDRDRIILIGILQPLLDCQALDLNWSGHTLYERMVLKDKLDPLFATQYPDLTVAHWFKANAVDEHPNSVHRFKARAGLRRFLEIEEGDDGRKSYKRLHRARFSPTAAYGNNEVHLHPTEPRRISVAEALAIQSLPAKYEFPPDLSLTDMFKCIGNGVPLLMARGISKVIKEKLEEVVGLVKSNHRSKSRPRDTAVAKKSVV